MWYFDDRLPMTHVQRGFPYFGAHVLRDDSVVGRFDGRQ